MFFDFQFRSLCGIARIPYAAGGLEQQVVELPPQNYSVAKILKKARLQGPVSGCQNQPKTGYVRRYLQSKTNVLCFESQKPGQATTGAQDFPATDPLSGLVQWLPIALLSRRLQVAQAQATSTSSSFRGDCSTTAEPTIFRPI